MAAAVCNYGSTKDTPIAPTTMADTTSISVKSTGDATPDTVPLSSDSERPAEAGKKSSRSRKSSKSSSSTSATSASASASATSATNINSSNGGTLKKQSSNRRLNGQGSSSSGKERRESSRLTKTPNPKKSSLSKSTSRRHSHAITQLGINPLATNDEDKDNNAVANGNALQQVEQQASTTSFSEEGSLRFSTLQNSPSTAITSSCTSFSTTTNQQSAATILVLPRPADSYTTTTTSESHSTGMSSTSAMHSSQHKHILVADPDAMLAQILQAVGQSTQEDPNGKHPLLSDQLAAAMHKLVQTATENGTIVVPPAATGTNNNTSPSSQNSSNSNTNTNNRLDQLQRQMEEMNKHQQALLEFQKQTLQERQKMEQTLQQQSQLIQQQADMLQQQQAQIQQLTHKIEQPEPQRRNHPSSPTKEQQQTAKEPALQYTPSPTKDETMETSQMLDRLAAFEELEASFKDLAMLGLPVREIKVIEDTPNAKPMAITTRVKDDEDDSSEPGHHEPGIVSKKDGLVDVWTCPSCNFEHEVTALQFCGVCGTSKPEENKFEVSFAVDSPFIKPDDNDEGSKFEVSFAADSPFGKPADKAADDNHKFETSFQANSPNQSPRKNNDKPRRSVSPPRAQEPLIQLQLHKELLKTDKEEIPKDMPPKSPMRRSNKFARSKSATDANLATTPKRTRPRIPPRSKTQMEDQLAKRMIVGGSYHGGSGGTATTPKKTGGRGRANMENRMAQQVLTAASYHGQERQKEEEEEIVIKCLDGNGGTELLDMDILNQQLSQLSTFDSAPAASAGAAPTASAPKTPKINKRRQVIRRSKSALDDPGASLPAAPPVSTGGFAGTTHRPSVRKAIPRRGRANSTDQLRLHQLQFQGGGEDAAASADDEPTNPAPAHDNNVASAQPTNSSDRRGILGVAVSAFHKSPKKAITAFKLAGGAMPKALVGGGKDKGRGFLLDSDDESNSQDDDDDHRKTNRSSSFRQLSDEPDPPKIDAVTMTPGRKSIRSSVASKSGWNKWFKAAPLADEVTKDTQENECEFDIDDSVHDIDDEEEVNMESIDESESDLVRRPRLRRNKSNEMTSDRSSGHSNRRASTRASVREEFRGSERGSNQGMRDARTRPRRAKSMDNTDDHSDAIQNFHSGDFGDTQATTESAKAGKPREMNRRRRASAVQRRKVGSDGPENAEDLKSRTEQLKQRVQGLRKGSGELQRTPKAEAADDISESTDGCTIYLENSIGNMSEITSPAM
ncbi:expressed unknown protein [Seminavis robusta]|uniref:Uncharacterized protein n=1 Tax=Seminavis robusta TaxID=568900 RepID=A0A9N8H9L4_9STRA|nr:expressed unknown protein [Seminavis robusta]|eukprot:Sro259_g101320.1 n/a (1244) ;mRNA; r:30317-34048